MTSKGYEGIGGLGWLAFNTARKPFDDARVRQAIAYAIDKNFIAKALNGGFASVADGPIIATSPYASADLKKYPLDLKRAEQLLDEAGLKKDGKGERMTLTVDYMPGSDVQGKNVAEYLRSQLKKVGIVVQVRASPDFPTWAKRIASHDFDLTTDIVFNWGDPVIGVHRTYLSSNIRDIVWTNTQSYRNPKVDALLEQAGVETDEGKRRALYAEFQKLVTEDLPIDFLTVIPYHTLASRKVHGLPDGIWGVLSPLDETGCNKAEEGAMLRYLGRRLAYALALLLAVVTLNFLLIHISPGDPVETIAGSMGGISEELRAQLRAIRLDKPFIAQLGLYLGQVLRGDLGHSYFFNLPVTQLIWDRVPATLLLVVTSVLGAFLAGTLLARWPRASQRAAVAGHHAAVHRRVLGAGVLDRHPAHHPVRVDAADLPGVRHAHGGRVRAGLVRRAGRAASPGAAGLHAGLRLRRNTAGWRAPA